MEKKYLKDTPVEGLNTLIAGDVIYFDMPPFCSGEYSAKVREDEGGLFIDGTRNYFGVAYDHRINKPYWKEEWQDTEKD